MKPFFVTSLFFVFLFSCKSQQYTIADLPETQLIFGNGGGITGEETTYTMLENGQLFKHSSLLNEHSELESITKKEAALHYDKLLQLKLAALDFNHPGNRYYFIEEVQGEEKHRVTLGSNHHDIPEEYKSFYKELRTTIK